MRVLLIEDNADAREMLRKCFTVESDALHASDRTHRTAIEFHRKRREKRDFSSELSEIPMIGDKRKMKLLRHFGSIERIAKASVDELKPYVGPKAAAEIASHFEKQRQLAPAPIETEN